MAIAGPRKAALLAGEIHYFTGKFCPKGHVSKRFVSDKSCYECRMELHKNRVSEKPLEIMEYSKKWYEANKERHKLVGYEWRKENKEKFNLTNKAWRENNRDHVNSIAREYRAKNKGKTNIAVAKWRKTHPEQAQKNAQYYGMIAIAIKRGSSRGGFTRDDLFGLVDKQNGKCVYCEIKLSKIHFDHIMPIALGGENELYNLQALCPTCNTRKGKKHPDIFAAKIAAERMICQKL